MNGNSKHTAVTLLVVVIIAVIIAAIYYFVSSSPAARSIEMEKQLKALRASNTSSLQVKESDLQRLKLIN